MGAKHETLQLEDPREHRVVRRGRQIAKRIILRVRLSARAVQPCAALRDEAAHTCRIHRLDYVSGSDLPQPRVRTELLGRETRREVGQLMNDHIGPRGTYGAEHGLAVVDIEESGFCAVRPQPFGAPRITGGANNVVPRVQELRN